MKKITSTFTAAVLALTLAGCSNTTPAVTTTVATTEASTTAETTTEATETAPETTSAAASESVSDEEPVHLFRGYLNTSGGDDYLMKEPDDNSEKLEELTFGTIMEIYSCNKEGWYSAEIGSDLKGYIRADLVEEMPHRLPFGERLFGGYIDSEEGLWLMSDGDVHSEGIRLLPNGTKVDIYESDYNGWYMTAVINENDGFDTGYLKASCITEIQGLGENGTYEPKISDIQGSWIHEKQSNIGEAEFKGTPAGKLVVSEYGLFTYTTDQGNTENGVVRVVYEKFENGAIVPWFVFYDNNGGIFMGCAAEAPENRSNGCLYIGNDGTERLVPEN